MFGWMKNEWKPLTPLVGIYFHWGDISCSGANILSCGYYGKHGMDKSQGVDTSVFMRECVEALVSHQKGKYLPGISFYHV